MVHAPAANQGRRVRAFLLGLLLAATEIFYFFFLLSIIDSMTQRATAQKPHANLHDDGGRDYRIPPGRHREKRPLLMFLLAAGLIINAASRRRGRANTNTADRHRTVIETIGTCRRGGRLNGQLLIHRRFEQ